MHNAQCGDVKGVKIMIEVEVKGVAIANKGGDGFVVILKEKGGQRHMMLVVGESEAAAIAIKLSGVAVPRPITQDLFASVLRAYGIRLTRVDITCDDGGMFHGTLALEREGEVMEIDGRPSDGIALALRHDAPIMVSDDVMTKLAIKIQEDEDSPEEISRRPEDMDVEQLRTLLAQHVENEAYEEASRIQKIIIAKTKGGEDSAKSEENV